jgi:hypothetical protein
MAIVYKVIDSDGHVTESPDMFEQYIEPKFREACPQVMFDDNGGTIVRVDPTFTFKEVDSFGDRPDNGIDAPSAIAKPKKRITFGAADAIGAREGKVDPHQSYLQGRIGGYDPHARIADMDMEGIDAAILYPTIGLWVPTIKDPVLAAADSRAYNRWLADYCKPYPDRLLGAPAKRGKRDRNGFFNLS